jgi:hypothetical protein
MESCVSEMWNLKNLGNDDRFPLMGVMSMEEFVKEKL